MKYIILSEPKAGTYLCANLMNEFGIKFEGYHLNKNRYQIRNNNNLLKEENIPFLQSIDLINENTVAVTHMHALPDVVSKLKSFKKIVLTRDYNERLDSWRRWKKMKPDAIPKKLVSYQTAWNNYNWLNERDIFHLEFNDLINNKKEKIDQLQSFLFNDIKFDSINCINNAKKHNSLTKSNIR
jgi:predicted MPP superfamily phosphohydrolase